MDPIAPAASTQPTETPNAASDTLASLDPKEMQTWRETGEIPVRAPVEPVEDEGDDEPEPAAAVVAPASAPVSKRQQRINDAVQKGVEAATKDLNAELARLRAAQPPPRPEPRVAAPAVASPSLDPADPEPDFNDAEKYPGGEYDPKYLRAVARWDMRQERRQEQVAAQTRDREQQQEQAFRTSAKAAADAWTKKSAADPDFVKRLNLALMKDLIPASQIPIDPTTGDRLFPLGPLNVIAEEMLANPDTAPDMADYLSTHPEELARLTATDPRTGVPLIPARQLIREMGRIEGALSRGVEPLPLPNTITDAPAPPTTLGSRSTTAADPKESALKAGNYEAYKRAADAEEIAAARRT